MFQGFFSSLFLHIFFHLLFESFLLFFFSSIFFLFFCSSLLFFFHLFLPFLMFFLSFFMANDRTVKVSVLKTEVSSNNSLVQVPVCPFSFYGCSTNKPFSFTLDLGNCFVSILMILMMHFTLYSFRSSFRLLMRVLPRLFWNDLHLGS